MPKPEEKEKKIKAGSDPLFAASYDTKEKVSWETLEDFHNKTMADSDFVSRYGAAYAEYDKMDIYQLRECLMNDEKSKSRPFQEMCDSVDRLLKLSASKGKETVDGKEKVHEFYELLSSAKSKVESYIEIRGRKKFHVHDYGKRRLELAERINVMLSDIENMNRMKIDNLSEKNRRMAEYAAMGLSEEEIARREALLRADEKTGDALDLMKVIESGQFGPELEEEEAEKLQKTWLLKDYKTELKKYLEDPEKYNTQEKMNEFLAILNDKNNRLLANKVTVNSIADSDSKLTHGYPWLKKDLKAYIDSKISKEDMLGKKPEEIADITRQLMAEFGNANKDRLQKISLREKKIVSLIELSDKTEKDSVQRSIRDYPQIEMLLNEPDDEVFESRFEEIKNKVEADSALIKEKIAGEYSVAFRDEIYKRMNAAMAGRRLFASIDEIMLSVETGFERLKFTMPDIYMAQRKLNKVLSSNNITEESADSFVMSVTANKPEELIMMLNKPDFDKSCEKFIGRYSDNRSEYKKKIIGYFGFDRFAYRFTKDVWDKVDALVIKAGQMEQKDFSKELDKLINEGKKKTGEKVTLNEYRLRRTFQTEEEREDRIKRTQREEDNIIKLGPAMHRQFLLRIASDGKSGLGHFRKADRIYRGTDGQIREDDLRLRQDYADIIKKRKEQFHNALEDAGIPKDKWKSYDRKFRWMISGILSNDEAMHSDEIVRNKRLNLERYGVLDWDEALAKLSTLLPDIEDGKEPDSIKETKERCEERLSDIKAYGGGRYKEIAEIIADAPSFRSAILNDDRKVFEEYLQKNIDPMFKNLAACLEDYKKDAYFAEATYRQYVYSNRDLFFAGSLKGDRQFFMKELNSFNGKIFSGIINKNWEKAEAELLEEYRKHNKKSDPEKSGKKKKTNTGAGEKAVVTAALAKVVYDTDDTSENFEKLLDAEKMKELALPGIEITLEKDQDKAALKTAGMIFSFKQEANNWMQVDTQLNNKNAQAAKQKAVGIVRNEGEKKRREFLDLNKRDILTVRRAKSLLRFGDDRIQIDHGREMTEYRKDRKFVSASASDVNKVRGFIMQHVNFVLPKVLMDALVEEGASEYYWERRALKKEGSGVGPAIIRHARAMNKYYNILTRDSRDEKAMSEDEARMFLLSAMTDRQFRYIFESGGDTEAKEIRDSAFYKGFRVNYKKLREMEKEDYKDPTVERELREMSGDLRLILITHMGLNVGDRKNRISINKINDESGKAIERHHKYLKYSAKLSGLIRQRARKYYDDLKLGMSDFFIDRQVLTIREYFMKDVTGDLEGDKEFDEEAWKSRIDEVYSDKSTLEAVTLMKESFSSEDAAQAEDQRVGHRENEAALLGNVIRKSQAVFHGRSNKYEKLDADQKKFFALALTLMDRSALGYGSEGSIAAINSKEIRQKEIDEIEKQVSNYIEGREYHINIDYRDAVYKLLDYRSSYISGQGYELSQDAFDKALMFAKSIREKKMQFEGKEVDIERISNGRSSIEAAFGIEGKKQKNEVDRMNSLKLEDEDVKNMLLTQCKNDQVSARQIAVGAGFTMVAIVGFGISMAVSSDYKKTIADNIRKKCEEELKIRKESFERDNGRVITRQEEEALREEIGREITRKDLSFGDADSLELISSYDQISNLGLAMGGISAVDKPINKYRRMNRLQRKIKALKGEDLKLFLRIMQDRSLLDKSLAESDKYVKQEERDALFEALSGDERIQHETLKDFDDNESCHKAVTNAFSFRLRDDKFFKGKVISRGDFEDKSFNRTTLVDWDLIEKAFEFMDQVKERRLERYVSEHAGDYIRESNNKKAIAMYDRLEKIYGKKKESFDQKEFEKQMAMISSHDNDGRYFDKSIERNWSGYMALTDKEKALFFRVLARRDLLDISKKDYVKSFFGRADRNYMNASGRDRLIDEYISLSMGDGVGLTLDEDAYYEGMKSLLSTQVSDRVNLKKETDMKKIFSYERNFIMSRDTAVDWKLFERALNFVHRANKELRTREGNELLYQGAGNMLKNGRMQMDYRFLRRNFHKTGNQWFRYAGRRTVQVVNDKFGGVLDKILDVGKTANDIGKIIGIESDGAIGQGLGWLADLKQEYQDLLISTHDDTFVSLQARTKDEQKEHDKPQEQKDKEKAEAEKKKKELREKLLFYDRLEEGFKSIIATKKKGSDTFDRFKKFLKDNIDINLIEEVKEAGAEADEENLFYKMTKGMSADKDRGDILDIPLKAVEKGKSVKKAVKDAGKVINSTIPGGKEILSIGTHYAEKLIWDTIIQDNIMSFDLNTYNKDGSIQKSADRLNSYDRIEMIKNKTKEFAKNKFKDIFDGAFGKGVSEKILKTEDLVYNFEQTVSKRVDTYMKYFDYAEKCTKHICSIAKSFSDISLLSTGREKSGERHEEDSQKLEKAKGKRLDESQLEKAKTARTVNTDTVNLAGTITKAMKGLNIASETINMAIDTVNQFAGKFNYTERMITTAVKEGLEFMLFAARILTDRVSLKDYLVKTDSGKDELRKLMGGYEKSAALHRETMKNRLKKYDNKSADTAKEIKSLIDTGSSERFDGNTEIVDLVSDSRGYEHTSELVEDTGMQIAQSLVFCASCYNPMAESKLMALTVMTVLGIPREEIGKTSPEIVKKVFEGLKMAR